MPNCASSLPDRSRCFVGSSKIMPSCASSSLAPEPFSFSIHPAQWHNSIPAKTITYSVVIHPFVNKILSFLARSIECNVMEMSVAAWNTDVHMPLLHLALLASLLIASPSMACLTCWHPASIMPDRTTAQPCRELLPKNLTVEQSEAKLVDLSINVRPEMEPAVAEHIRLLLPNQLLSNQSPYKLLCWWPSAVYIETKCAASFMRAPSTKSRQMLPWPCWDFRPSSYHAAHSISL